METLKCKNDQISFYLMGLVASICIVAQNTWAPKYQALGGMVLKSN
jgi:hypothetical protein